MKNIINIIVLLLTISTFAQLPVDPTNPTPSITLPRSNYDDSQFQQNCYIKDTLNEINFWEGTWVYNDGNTTFRIILEKVEMYYQNWRPDNEKYFTDEMFGGYFYKNNGVVITDQWNYDNDIFYPFTNPLSGNGNFNNNTGLRLVLFLK